MRGSFHRPICKFVQLCKQNHKPSPYCNQDEEEEEEENDSGVLPVERMIISCGPREDNPGNSELLTSQEQRGRVLVVEKSLANQGPSLCVSLQFQLIQMV